MKTYQIGEIAEKMGVSTDTLRYYDKEGLLPFATRNAAGRRQFTDNDLGYIEVIDCMKKSGIPVKEIAQFIEMCMTGDETLQERYDFLTLHEANLEAKIEQLQSQLAFLRWKKWYYQRAQVAGTETANFIPGTTTVDPKLHQVYQESLQSRTIAEDQPGQKNEEQ